MTTAGKRLLTAANEALAIAKREADPSTYVVHAPPEAVDVKAIRLGLDMTQKDFGLQFGFGPARIRDWEQGRTRPAQSDRVLLITIKSNPGLVLRALAKEARANRVNESDERPAYRPARSIARAKPANRTSRKVVA